MPELQARANAVTFPLYAAIATAAGTIIGCAFGFIVGRREERRAWCKLMSVHYRNCKDLAEFRVRA